MSRILVLGATGSLGRQVTRQAGVFAARWLGLAPGGGQYFLLGTASLSKLGYDHGLSEPVTLLWNETANAGRQGGRATVARPTT
jgi:hypothetical protein